MIQLKISEKIENIGDGRLSSGAQQQPRRKATIKNTFQSVSIPILSSGREIDSSQSGAQHGHEENHITKEVVDEVSCSKRIKPKAEYLK